MHCTALQVWSVRAMWAGEGWACSFLPTRDPGPAEPRAVVLDTVTGPPSPAPPSPASPSPSPSSPSPSSPSPAAGQGPSLSLLSLSYLSLTAGPRGVTLAVVYDSAEEVLGPTDAASCYLGLATNYLATFKAAQLGLRAADGGRRAGHPKKRFQVLFWAIA